MKTKGGKMVRIRYFTVVMGLLATVGLSMAQIKEGKRFEGGEEGHQFKHRLISISGYVQSRWELRPGFENTFRIRRAYIGAKGDVTDWLAYRILLTIPDMSISLYDAYVDIKPLKVIALRVGQFQQPIGMEKLISSSAILFPERTFASGCDEFPLLDRDIGIMLAGKYKFVGLQAGVFNGVGRNLLDNNSAKDITARLTLKPFEFVHVGGAYQTHVQPVVEYDTLGIPTDTTDWDCHRYGAELALTPWDLWLAAEFMGGANDTIPLMTYYAEAGWTFKLGLDWLYGIQPAARYEFVDPNTDADDDSRTIITAGINFHILPKHPAKLALCYRMIMEETAEVDNDQIIAQLQLMFP
jgi:hypothetical protein